VPGAQVRWLATGPGPVRTDNDMLGLVADAAYEDLPDPEIVLVPGGLGTRALLDDERLVGWIRRAHETSEWTTSVCTGSLLLGAAGASPLSVAVPPDRPPSCFAPGRPPRARSPCDSDRGVSSVWP
jgi:putative intracellular protease/amidase